jgi:hypothetical protein
MVSIQKKLLVKPLICWAHLCPKSSFFIWGFKINFQEKIKHGMAKGKHGHFRYNETL